MILGRTRKMPTSRSSRRPRLAVNGGVHSFKVGSRIAKAVGEDKRYKLNAVRALPSRRRAKWFYKPRMAGRRSACLYPAD